MKKIISLILAAMLLCSFAALAEEAAADERQTYTWEQFGAMAEQMGAEGNFAEYSQFGMKLWIPAEFIQADKLNDRDADNGFIDFFGNDEYPLEIGVQYMKLDEDVDTVEDLLEILNKEQYDAPTLARINPYDALLLTVNGGEHMIVALAGGGGLFVLVHYYKMNADQWCIDRTALSMASIQPIE